MEKYNKLRYNEYGDNMKNNLKKIIYLIVLIAITAFASYFLKDALNEKAKNNLNSNNTEITTNTTQNNEENNQTEFEEAIVTKIIDGDTIGVTIDGKYYKVRFIGINCPEYTKEIEPYGKEATEYTTEKLSNKTVYLQKDITNTDDYDRLLRYVWLEKVDTIDEESVKNYWFNYDLVANGLAQSNYYKPNITLQDYLENAEIHAKRNKIGMWE